MSGFGDEGCGTALAVIAVAVLLAIVIFAFLPYILFVLEVLVVPLVVIFKIVFRRPFTVQARGSDGSRRVWRVIGWRASADAVDEVARALEQGREPLLDARTLVSAV